MDNSAETEDLVLTVLNIAGQVSRGNGDTPSKNGSRYSPEKWMYYDIFDRMGVSKAFIRAMDPVIRAAAVCPSTMPREVHKYAAKIGLDGHGY